MLKPTGYDMTALPQEPKNGGIERFGSTTGEYDTVDVLGLNIKQLAQEAPSFQKHFFHPQSSTMRTPRQTTTGSAQETGNRFGNYLWLRK